MRALVIEDDPVFCAALVRAVQGLGSAWHAGVCTSAAQAHEAIARTEDDLHLALVDIGLPDGSGLDVIGALRQHRPDVPALVVSSFTSERSVLEAIARGARGYLHKDEPVQAVSASLAQVLQGHYPISPSLARHLFNRVKASVITIDETPAHLTPKEVQTLRGIARGLSYSEVAQDMQVSLSTVQSHIRSLYRKLQVRSQVQAVGKAREKGLL